VYPARFAARICALRTELESSAWTASENALTTHPGGPAAGSGLTDTVYLRLRRIFAMYAFAAADPFTSRARPRRFARFAALRGARRDATLREALRRRRGAARIPFPAEVAMMICPARVCCPSAAGLPIQNGFMS
jgi:hypothetical protein